MAVLEGLQISSNFFINEITDKLRVQKKKTDAKFWLLYSNILNHLTVHK